MRRVRLLKWMYLIAGSGILLQAAPGCPDAAMVRGAASAGVQSLILEIVGVYVENVVNLFFHV